jgi:hypothetical protein
VLVWRDSELDLESVVPHLLHIIPVLDDTMLDGVRGIEDTSPHLSLITEVLILELSTGTIVTVPRSSDDRREDASGGIFS